MKPGVQYVRLDGVSLCVVAYTADEWEVPREQVVLVKKLGKGSFGKVHEGLLCQPDQEVKKVAVKV